MDSGEINQELAMTYDEMVNYLLGKYGKAEHDYYRNEACKSKNPNVSRISEGLFCHHIDEKVLLQKFLQLWFEPLISAPLSSNVMVSSHRSFEM